MVRFRARRRGSNPTKRNFFTASCSPPVINDVIGQDKVSLSRETINHPSVAVCCSFVQISRRRIIPPCIWVVTRRAADKAHLLVSRTSDNDKRGRESGPRVSNNSPIARPILPFLFPLSPSSFCQACAAEKKVIRVNQRLGRGVFFEAAN